MLPEPAIAAGTAAGVGQGGAVLGHYLVRVERLSPTGEAEGVVLHPTQAPPDDALALVAAGRAGAALVPEHVSVVGGLPGEVVKVELRWSIPRPGRRSARRMPPPSVRVLRVVEAAAERVAAPCPVFGVCGGCQLQHLRYDEQLAWKARRVREALTVAGLDDAVVAPTLACEPPWHYRNQMRFSVNRAGQVGLTARGNHRVLPLAACPIAAPSINQALALLSQVAQPMPQVLVRASAATGQVLLQPTPAPTVRSALEADGLTVTTEALEERLGGATFRIRPSSFFQTNTRQAEQMVALVREALPAGPEVTLVDAYCGVGTFARVLAAQAGHVLAIEESASAVRDATWNLRDVPSVEIVQGKVEHVLPELARRPDGLVIDPPRAGCQPPVLEALVRHRPARLVYVSCEPRTLARDLALLCASAYRLLRAQPLDMFPQTAHIETVAVLEAR